MTLAVKKFTTRLSWKPKPNRKPRFFLQNLPKPTDRKHFETITTLLSTRLGARPQSDDRSSARWPHCFIADSYGNTKYIRWRGRRRRRGRDSLNALEAGDMMRPNHLRSLPLRQRRSSFIAVAASRDTCLSNWLTDYSCTEDTIFVVSNPCCIVDLFHT